MITIQIQSWFIWVLFLIAVVNVVQTIALITIHRRNKFFHDRILKKIRYTNFLKGKQ